MQIISAIFATLALALTSISAAAATAESMSGGLMRPLRVATFNTSLNHDEAGGLIKQLSGDHLAARQVAAVIQRVRPDLVLLNEFDYDAGGQAAELFVSRYLGQGQFGERAIRYTYRFQAAVNTGVASGLDLTGDGETNGPGDAWGFGMHPGQYGMLVLSRHPIDREHVRTFQQLRWSAMPGAHAPLMPNKKAPWFAAETWAQLRLSSKSHWDVPVQTPLGTLHFLAAHPTPPVFDGPEDRNGRRNFDEIRLWAEYLSNPDAPWLCDDNGRCGGLNDDARFVIAGDYNADPQDGESIPGAIAQLLTHPRVLTMPAPTSAGAAVANTADAELAASKKTPAAEHTGAFGPRAGNMRIDYVLPSLGFSVVRSGVFWPPPDRPEAQWLQASDHRMVWVDLRLAANTN
ncbi:MAG: endonuclease/exonuclease/phosphatase family protein [Pseudomarimonas sp.]